MKVEGKIALITGAASGLGRQAAIRWAASGGIVVAIDRDEAGLQLFREKFPRIQPHAIDVTDSRAVAELIGQTESDVGPIERVDNAAGIFPTDLAVDMPVETFRRVMEVNYLAMVNVSLCVLPLMSIRRSGVLVNYCSIAGLVPYLHMAAYSAAKHASVVFTETLYQENRASGVQIVCLCPPRVDTPLLEQATSKPKMLTVGKGLTCDQTLDALQIAIERKKFWCLPSRKTRLAAAVRRFVPRLSWWINHRIEGI